MQRVDAAYVYELGAQLRPILALQEQPTTKIQIFHVINPSLEALKAFLFISVYVQHAKAVHSDAQKLLTTLEELVVDFTDTETFSAPVSEWGIKHLKDRFRAFEAVLLAELQGFPLYLVHQRAGLI